MRMPTPSIFRACSFNGSMENTIINLQSSKTKPTQKCQKPQFIEWPLEGIWVNHLKSFNNEINILID